MKKRATKKERGKRTKEKERMKESREIGKRERKK